MGPRPFDGFRFSTDCDGDPYNLPSFTIVEDPPINTDNMMDYYVLKENRPLPPSCDDGDWCIEDIIDPLLKRLLDESESLAEYNMEIVESNIMVVRRCLWILHKLYLPSDRG